MKQTSNWRWRRLFWPPPTEADAKRQISRWVHLCHILYACLECLEAQSRLEGAPSLLIFFFFYVQVQVSSRVSVSFGSRRIPPTHPVRFHFQRSFSQELWAAQKEVLTPWFAWFPPRIYLLTHQPGCCCCSRLSDRVEINKKDKRNLSNYSYPEKINKAFIYLTEWIAFQLNIHLGILQCRLPGCFWYRKTKQRQQ